MGLKKTFRGLALKILDLDDTAAPRNQIDLIKDCTRKRERFDTAHAADLNDLVATLQKKHAVNSIVISNGNGSIVASNNANAHELAVARTALFNYINNEIPQSETVLIKTSEWHIMISYNGKVYIINAESDLTQSELKAIAREVEGFLSNNNKVF